MEPNTQKGVPIEIIIKVKPEPHQRVDIRVYENKISLLDQYDRAVDEFITNGVIIENIDGFATYFDNTIGKYLGFVIHGVNLSIFTFGSKASGKTFCFEGNQNESGIYALLVENLFRGLEAKRDAILEEVQKLNIPEVEATSYTFSIRMKYVEIRDEGIIDLLQKYNYYKQPTQLIYSESEGWMVTGSAWVALPNSMAFPDLLAEAIKFRSNFEYNKVTKISTMMVFEINQILENRSTRDVKVINSKIILYDLPSADILAEHFRNLSNSMEYKSIYAFQNMVGELAKTNNNALPTIYDNSALTKLMKESIGANALCVGIFTLQNNNYVMSNITFKVMKLCSHVQNFPILNDVNAHGLLKKFRTDISFYSKFKNSMPFEIKPPVIPKGGNEITLQKPDGPIGMDISLGADAKARIQFLENENARLQNELRSGEDDKMNMLKSLSGMRNKYDQAKEFLPPGDRYDVSDKLLHIEDDITEVNEIMNVVNKLNDKLKALEEERRALSEEIETFRVNNQNLSADMDRITMEANNSKTNSDNEIYNLKELLNSTKNELDYMRNEAEKYRKIHSDLLLELDEREVQFKTKLEDKEREIEMKMLDISQNEKRRLESELREATRKLEHYGEENNDFSKVVEELKKDNKKLTLQIKEMRSTMRDILAKEKDPKDDANNNTDSNPSSKAKLMKTYTDRENELMEQISIEKAKTENLKEKLKKMRTYGRKARNIALDYFPINEELPEMLTKDINVFLEDAENESVIQFLEFEIRTLRERNKKLEYEMNRIKEEYKVNPYKEYQKSQSKVIPNLLNSTNKTGTSQPMNETVNQENSVPELSEKEIQKRILEEINKLKNGSNNSNSVNVNTKELEKLRQDNLKLLEENKRLKTMMNDAIVKEGQDSKENDNPKALRQKILFLEKSVEELEKERSEFSMRATMAEEQLKNFQEMFNTTTQGYQKKILELNKRLEAASMRADQNYRNHNRYGDEVDDIL